MFKARKTKFKIVLFIFCVVTLFFLFILLFIGNDKEKNNDLNTASYSADEHPSIKSNILDLFTGSKTEPTTTDTTTANTQPTTTDTTGTKTTDTTTEVINAKTPDTTPTVTTTPVDTSPTNTTTPTTTNQTQDTPTNTTTTTQNQDTTNTVTNTTTSGTSPALNFGTSNSQNTTNSPEANTQNQILQDQLIDSLNNEKPTNFLSNTEPYLQNILDKTTENANKTLIFLEDPEIKIVTNTATLAGIILGAFTLGAGIIPAAPMGLPDTSIRLWSLFLYAFGFKRKRNPWGTVYDSSTKQPLDPAHLVLKDEQGKEISTCITDMDGRYGFLVEPGKYIISSNKTHYTFPSTKLINQTSDELYQDLYFGTTIEINKTGEIINRNIPMDRVNFDWNEFAKNEQQKMRFFRKKEIWINQIARILFFIGFILAFMALFETPKLYNLIIFIIYSVFYFMRRRMLSKHLRGTVIDEKTNTPLSYGILRIFLSSTGKEIAKKITDRLGNYYCIIQNGSYVISIDRKNLDGTYSNAYTSPKLIVKKGFLKKNFKI